MSAPIQSRGFRCFIVDPYQVVGLDGKYAGKLPRRLRKLKFGNTVAIEFKPQSAASTLVSGQFTTTEVPGLQSQPTGVETYIVEGRVTSPRLDWVGVSVVLRFYPDKKITLLMRA